MSLTTGSVRHLVPRAGTGAVLIGIAVVALVFEQAYRQLEASLAGHLFSWMRPTLVAPHAPIVYFGLGQAGAFGLLITPECSSALLIAPVAILGAILLGRRRVQTHRVWLAVSLTSGLLIMDNEARIGLIAWLIGRLGIHTGYEWGHLVVGSLVSLLFICGGLALMVWIVASGRPREVNEATP